jgi:hypothetical protein
MSSTKRTRNIPACTCRQPRRRRLRRRRQRLRRGGGGCAHAGGGGCGGGGGGCARAGGGGCAEAELRLHAAVAEAARRLRLPCPRSEDVPRPRWLQRLPRLQQRLRRLRRDLVGGCGGCGSGGYWCWWPGYGWTGAIDLACRRAAERPRESACYPSSSTGRPKRRLQPSRRVRLAAWRYSPLCAAFIKYQPFAIAASRGSAKNDCLQRVFS